jgi:flagellar basal body-associated protein FliL
MFLWILQMIVISIVLIASIHYIFVFFKENLTIPKTKDLVNKPVQNYKKMLNIKEKTETNTDSMKSELAEYLKKLVPKNNVSETPTPKKENTIDNQGNFFQANQQYSSY